MRRRRRRRGERQQLFEGRAQRFGESHERVGADRLLTLFDEHQRGPWQAHGLGQLQLGHPAAQASDVQAQGTVEVALTIDQFPRMIARGHRAV
jgi:hypothetical protein